jgi:hypothetical protein
VSEIRFAELLAAIEAGPQRLLRREPAAEIARERDQRAAVDEQDLDDVFHGFQGRVACRTKSPFAALLSGGEDHGDEYGERHENGHHDDR